MAEPTAYDFELNTLAGEPLDLRRFAGRPMLVVNTASKCGFTPQYKGLQDIWSLYGDRGLVVIGVPSHDFGQQEPGSASDIKAFCSLNYGVSFPMTEKLHVRGAAAHPLFKWFGHQGGALSRPRWNFYKYIVGRDGSLSTWFTSLTKPDNARLRSALDRVVQGG